MRIDQAKPPASHFDASSRIALRIGGSTHFVPIGKIRYVSVLQGISIVAVENERLTVHERLGCIEKKLPPTRFLRISRFTLVNLDWVKAFKPRTHGDQTIYLVGGVELVVSRTRRRAFLAALNLRMGTVEGEFRG